MIKLIIGIIFLGILVSLGWGAVALVGDKGNSRKLVNSLTVRVLLSVLLFLFLIIAYMAGLIHPHGLIPAAP